MRTVLRINWATLPAREIQPGVVYQRYERDWISVVRYRLGPRSSMPPLILGEEVIAALARGRAQLFIGEERVDLKAGDLCQIPSRTPYSASTGPEGAELMFMIPRRREQNRPPA